MSTTEDPRIQKAYDLGYDYEQRFRGCGQCTFAALQDTFSLRSAETDAVFKSATALAAGTGLEGDGQCGAYSGAAMMISYLAGRERDNFADPEGARKVAFRLTQKLHKEMIDTYGTVICNQIHRRIMGRPFYIRDPQEYQAFEDAGAHDDKCTSVVGEVASRTARILIEEGLAPEAREGQW
jgi:C_GCAxxG_C_C family probable redox protein